MSDTNSLAELQAKFGIEGKIKIDSGKGGLTRIAITGEKSEGEIYLQGAHVTQFKRRGGRDVLFMSKHSAFETGKAIRGGVPIIFPWFGARSGMPTAPAHGFARVREWKLESTSVVEDENHGRDARATIEVVMSLVTDEILLKAWDHQFVMRYRVRMGEKLEMQVEVENREKRPMVFDEALHTYFEVSDVKNILVRGLEGAEYIDTVPPVTRRRQGHDPLKLTARTDRIYVYNRETCTIEDPGFARKIVVEKSGSDGSVVWNPWAEKAAEMKDVGDEWPRFVCVESCNVGENGVRLSYGEKHTMTAKISEE